MKVNLKGALFLLLLLFGLGLVLLLWSGAGGRHVTQGRYLLGSSGSHILIDPAGSPIVLGDRSSGGVLFSGMEDGDRLLVLHDSVAETYPGRAGAYFCLRLDRGTADDLPAATLRQLSELGWLPS